MAAEQQVSGPGIFFILGGVVLTIAALVEARHSPVHYLSAALFGLCTLACLLQPWMKPRGLGRIEFDDREIRRLEGRRTVESISWNDLHEVGIVTTGEGPLVQDVYWLLLNRDRSSGCAFPNDAEGIETLLPRLQQLPGFDNEEMIKAMASVTDDRFQVWRRDDEMPLS